MIARMGDGQVALEDEPGVVGSEREARRLESEHSDPVPDAVAPPPHHPRFPLIDGMRAIAVLSVVLVHTTVGARDLAIVGPLLAHLNIGVTIFFLISGFLLYRPFIAHRGGGAAAPPVVQYAKRRLLRIYPAYWLVLTVLVIVPGTHRRRQRRVVGSVRTRADAALARSVRCNRASWSLRT